MRRWNKFVYTHVYHSKQLYNIHKTNVIHDGRPRRHRKDGEDGQHSQSDVVEYHDAVLGSDPVLGAEVTRRTVKAAHQRVVVQRARVNVVVFIQVVQS